MANVTLDVTLPDTAVAPGLGSPRYQPLGGDGWTSPHSVFEFGYSSPGTAGGDNNVITVTFDPRWRGIVSYVRLTNSSASAAIEMELQIRPHAPFTSPVMSAFSNATPVNSLSGVNEMTWSPPPVASMNILRGTTPNVNGDTLTLQAFVYNFNIRVLEQVPLALILASLPRGDSTFPVTTA